MSGCCAGPMSVACGPVPVGFFAKGSWVRKIPASAVFPAGTLPHRCFAWPGALAQCYSYSSPNQEAVLAAFEEEQWPRRIDDPLRPVVNMDAKMRLRNTIRTLNVKQENLLIHFRAAGTGEHVIWEMVEKGLACPGPRIIDLPTVTRPLHHRCASVS